MGFITFLTLALVIVAVWQLFSIRSTVEALGRELDNIRTLLARLRIGVPAPDQTSAASPVPLRQEHPAAPGLPGAVLTPPPAPAAPEPAAAPARLPPPLPPEATVARSPSRQPDSMPPPAPPPRQPCDLAPTGPERPGSAFGETLAMIWKWFLVGDEFRRVHGATERAIAATWLMRLTIVFLVGAVAYFLSWSIEHGLVGPLGRVGISTLFGVGLLIGGLRLLGGRWSLIGHGFMGGGLAILYFSMYAVGPMMFKLISSVPIVFGLMALVTVAAGVLSLRTGSMLVAILGIIGGFSTPILLSTGESNFPVLFAYILMLDLGILAIALKKQWRILNYLGFVFTYGLFIAAMKKYTVSDFNVVIFFLSLFFCVQSAVVYLHNIRRGIHSTLLEILHLILNAGAYALLAYPLIKDAAGNPYPAILTFGLALFFILHLAVFLRRRITDRPLLLSLMALAGFFATITFPIIMDKDALTICLSLEALMFVWLGGRIRCQFLRLLGHALFFIVFFRLAAWDFVRNYHGAGAPESMRLYLAGMADRLWTFGVAIASVFGAHYVERRAVRESLFAAAGAQGSGIQAGNDIPAMFNPPVAAEIFFWGLIASLCVYLQCEFDILLDYYRPLKPAALTAVWCAFAFFFLFRFLSERRHVMLGACLLFAAVAAAKAVFADTAIWNMEERFFFDQAYAPLDSLMRWLDFGAVLALFGLAWHTLRGAGKATRPVPSLFGYSGLALLFFFATLEANTLLHWKLPVFRDGGLSMLWAVFAASFLAGGIVFEVKPLRYMGLALFTIVVLKIFLTDLHGMPAIYRVLAMAATGLCLLAGAYAYLRFGRQQDGDEPAETSVEREHP